MMFQYPIFPWIPNFNIVPNIPLNTPPSLYQIMNSIENYNKPFDSQTPPNMLAEKCIDTIFNFTYPLSEKVDKTEFEVNILNHFINRRIGFETFTNFQIQLQTKLREIMPMYNKLFDSLEGWDLFESGQIITRDTTDNRTVNSKNENNNTLEQTSDLNSIQTSDRRYSDTPQNRLDDVKNGNYITEYNYDMNNNDSTTTSNSKGNDISTLNSTDNNVGKMVETRTPEDKIGIFKTFIESKNNIMTMIYKDLDCLFYQIVDF